jgi:GNAT superfamily N-acetyltransferase
MFGFHGFRAFRVRSARGRAVTTIRLAAPSDLEVLLPHVAVFHDHEGIRLPDAERRVAVAALLAPGGPGLALVAFDGDDFVGYAFVVFGFSVEFGGRDGFLDELYVAEAHRGKGIGRQIIARAEAEARKAGVRALHLEADHANPRAADLYRRLGFADHARHLMTKRLV